MLICTLNYITYSLVTVDRWLGRTYVYIYTDYINYSLVTGCRWWGRFDVCLGRRTDTLPVHSGQFTLPVHSGQFSLPVHSGQFTLPVLYFCIGPHVCSHHFFDHVTIRLFFLPPQNRSDRQQHPAVGQTSFPDFLVGRSGQNQEIRSAEKYSKLPFSETAPFPVPVSVLLESKISLIQVLQ